MRPVTPLDVGGTPHDGCVVVAVSARTTAAAART